MITTIHFGNYVLLAVVGIFAGFLGAISGGGGFLTLPMILLAGVPSQMALGTNKMLAALTTLSSSYVFIKEGIFQPRLWIPAIVSTIIAAIFGVIVALYVSSAFMNKALPVLIIVSALYSIIFSSRKNDSNDPNFQIKNFKPRPLSSSILSFVLGFYSSFAGTGLGVFWSSALQFFYKLKIVEAAGIARGMCVFSNFTSFFCFIIFGNVDYFIGILMGVCMSLGSYLGAYTAIKAGGQLIKYVLAIVSVGSTVYFLFSH